MVAGIAVFGIAGCTEDEPEDEAPEEEIPAEEETPTPAPTNDEEPPPDDDEEEVDAPTHPDDVPQGEDLLEYDGLEITEHEFVDEENPTVRGIVMNNRDEQVEYVDVAVRFYDDGGNLLVSSFTSTTDLPSGTEWAFEVIVTAEHEGDIESYDIRVSDSPFRERYEPP